MCRRAVGLRRAHRARLCLAHPLPGQESFWSICVRPHCPLRGRIFPHGQLKRKGLGVQLGHTRGGPDRRRRHRPGYSPAGLLRPPKAREITWQTCRGHSSGADTAGPSPARPLATPGPGGHQVGQRARKLLPTWGGAPAPLCSPFPAPAWPPCAGTAWASLRALEVTRTATGLPLPRGHESFGP